MLRGCGAGSVRAVGKLHCWSGAIVADEVLVLTDRLNSISVNQSDQNPTVTVGGGCQVGALVDELAKHGLTLPSIGLIDKQTIAGATATATHGSGKNSLSHYIVAARIAHFDEHGKPILTDVQSGPELKAAQCSLGMLGIVVRLTLQCRPVYRICEHAAQYDSLAQLLQQEPKYPLQQFYLMPWSWKYFAHHRVESDAAPSRLAWLYRIYRLVVVDVLLHVIVFMLSKLLTLRLLTRVFYRWVIGLTIPRHWQIVDDARDLLVMKHDLFRHIEIEIFVSRTHLPAATEFLVEALATFGGQRDAKSESEFTDRIQNHACNYFHRYPICFRRVLADEALISMSAPGLNLPAEDWYAISLISYQWPSQRHDFFEMASFIGRQMTSLFDARCHWGKHNPVLAHDHQRIYPNLPQFRDIRAQFDPANRFVNRWLYDAILDSAAASAGEPTEPISD